MPPAFSSSWKFSIPRSRNLMAAQTPPKPAPTMSTSRTGDVGLGKFSREVMAAYN
jgi:hypothetical protein